MSHKTKDLGIVSREGVASMIGVCVNTLDRMLKEGRFPPGTRLGATRQSRIVWDIETVNNWIKKNRTVDKSRQ